MANLGTLSFNSGELTPWLNARADVDKTKRGCRTLENFLVTTYGGIRRRPGLEFIALAKQTDPVRIWGFNYSSEVSYVIEFGEGYVRFFTDGAPLMDGMGVAPVELVTPYLQDDLFDLDIQQVNDVVVITHQNYPPATMTRQTATEWSYNPIDFLEGPTRFPPFLDENQDTLHNIEVNGKTVPTPAWVPGVDYQAGDAVEAASTDTYFAKRDHTSTAETEPGFGVNGSDVWSKASGGAPGGIGAPFPAGQPVELTSNEDTWDDPGHVGAYWEISHQRTISQAQRIWYSFGNLPPGGPYTAPQGPMRVLGGWRLNTQSSNAETFAGTLVLQRSFDNGGTWEDYRTYFNSGAIAAANRTNFIDTGDEPEECLMRLQYFSVLSSGAQNSVRLVAENLEVTGAVRINNVIDPKHAEGVVVREVFSDAQTNRWSEGAWSGLRGYPGVSTIHESRLIFGGTKSDPTTLWGSAVDDFFNFQAGTNDSDSWVYQIAATEQNEIRTLVSTKALLVLTSGSEWVIRGSGNGDPITPSSIRVSRHSNLGCADIQGLLINNATIFVQRGRRRVQEYTYNWSEENYNAVDLTMLADHVTRGGLVDFDYQRNRDSIIWAANGYGELVGMTYERNEQVYGWHRHTTQGNFENVAVIYGEKEEDEVWVAVERHGVSGTGAHRTIERFRPDQWRTLEIEDRARFFHVDSGMIYDGKAIDLVEDPRLEHLIGQEVEIWADGNAHPNRVVFAGSTPGTGGVTLEEPASVVVIGIGYVSKVSTFPVEVQMQDGVSLGRRKTSPRGFISVRSSLMAEVSSDDLDWELVDFRQFGEQGDPLDAGVKLFTGDYEVHLPGSHDREHSTTLRSVGPRPINLLALTQEITISRQ